MSDFGFQAVSIATHIFPQPVFDLNRTYPIDPAEFLSMGRATPFAGWSVQGRCLLTAMEGQAVWYDKTLLEGEDAE